MQFKLVATLSLLSTLGMAAFAIPAGTGNVNSSKCNTGPIQCCQTVQKASENPVANVLGVLGIPVQDVNVPIGLTCDPISVIGIGGTNCASQPVCCKENNFNGLVAVGCTPINVGL